MSGAAAAAAAPARADYKGYETPVWKLVRREGPFELREYEPYLAAEVTVKSGPDAALRQGFRTLAAYIFGENEGGSKVSMTAPVTRERSNIAMTAPVTREPSADAWTIRFMMPSAYDRQSLPRPNNAAIRLVTVEPGLRAVIGFSGIPTQARLANAEERLRVWVSANGMEVTGPMQAAWFDDPFTLPWRRRNEVSLPVSLS